jgi:N-acetylmuramic acid 6-phosphate (MurNAc-6-P) etherase
MASYIYIANGTSQISAAMATDKVRIATTGSPIAVAVGNSSVSANLTACEIIPAMSVERSFIVGQGNYIAFIVAGGDSAFSITELGMPHPNVVNGYMT